MSWLFGDAIFGAVELDRELEAYQSLDLLLGQLRGASKDLGSDAGGVCGTGPFTKVRQSWCG